MHRKRKGRKNMSFRCGFKIFSIMVVSMLCFMAGCSSPEVPKARADINGIKEEKIAYHQAEIKKYMVALKKEEGNERKYLDQHQMNDVRQASSRKKQYLKKIEWHVKAIEELIEQSV